MQVVLLCGGRGTRMWPTTEEVPKPMVKIGDKPILWYLMKYYSNFGHKDFIICLGHLGEKIRDYFSKDENKEGEWNIIFVETGEDTNKGQRVKQVEKYIKNDIFMTCFGDDLSNIDINKSIEDHIKKGKIVTLIAIRPISQFGIIEINEKSEVIRFKEKPRLSHFINGGFYVFNRKIFDYIKEGWDLEGETLEELVKKQQINAFKHEGFWVAMNTQKDINDVNKLWEIGELQKLLGY